MSEYDIYSTLPAVKVDKLLDGNGFVELMDCYPRICPIGRTSEYVIAKCARISYTKKELMLKSIDEDSALIRYLFTHDHSSPFEMPVLTFHVKAPIFVTRQWMRHRTGSYNEMSMRYVEVPEENCFYNPLHFSSGIRKSSLTNKQGSDILEDENSEIIEALTEANNLQDQVYLNYKKLCKLGLAREIARDYLPVGEYTHFVFQVNLRNLLNFLYQRCDIHAQLEIQVYANAIKKLIEPLFPTVMSCFEERRNSITLSPLEILILSGQKEYSEIKSKRERNEIEEKLEKLKITLGMKNE